MMEDLWVLFCGESGNSDTSGKPSGSSLIVSAILNGCIGFVNLCLGIWILEEKLRKKQSALPLKSWLVVLFQGFTWLLVGLIISLRGNHLQRTPLRLLSVLASLFAGSDCALSIYSAVLGEGMLVKIAMDVLSLPGAILLLLCVYKVYKHEGNEERGLYAPLNGEPDGASKTDSVDQVTPFAKAGFFNKISFWWLNPLMKKGKEKTLEDEDIPKLGEAERAESCYTEFLEQLNKQKQAESSQPSLLWTIASCHWKDIVISGFFAMLKILTLSAGPLLLNAFILVAEGKAGFKYEGYVLALTLFLSKSLESLSQRQWYFRSRLVGLKVRSLLTAAIYKKQQRLSNVGRSMHSGGEIMNYVTVDAYRIGEFPFWIHQTWTTSFQLCLSLAILFRAVGLATFAALVMIIITVLCNTPLAKLQHKFQSKLMVAQDARLKACNEALINMKVLKLYAWETHFKNAIENLRKVEYKWLSSVQLRKAYNGFLFWSSPVLVSAATFGACYFLKIPLHANNVFTFVATMRLVQDPIRIIPDLIGVIIQAKVAFARIVKFLEASELQSGNVRHKRNMGGLDHAVLIKSADFSWEENSSKPTLRNVSFGIRPGEKVAICGEVGSGKSTFLAAILGEVPHTQGTIQVCGKFAYVSQTAWIQTGSIQENILFGSKMDRQRYHDTLERCSLVKDLDLLPYGDLTEIGERGVNLSGGQKQRIQLARALYQNADIYLLDDPFSAVDAHTATSLFNDYIMGALSGKTVLLVTHQVDFLPAFDSVMLMSDGEILQAAPYHQLLSSSQEFLDLVNAHKETAGSERHAEVDAPQRQGSSVREIKKSYVEGQIKTSQGDQLIKQEEKEVGDTGFKPYLQYLNQNKGFLYFSLAVFCHVLFVICQITQNSWMAANVDDPHVTSDLSIVDLDVPFTLILAVGATTNVYSNLGVLAVVTWQVLFVSIPMVYLAIRLQTYYFASAKELMRINGTTKSLVANHLAESVAGAITIRAFEEEERFYAKTLNLIDMNASTFFHSFAANEWLIQRLEIFSATVVASAALCMVLLPPGTFSSGFIGMALSYGLSLNMSLVFSIQNQCTLANYIISVERLNQYMHIPSEAPEVIKDNRPPSNWPTKGKVDICDLQVLGKCQLQEAVQDKDQGLDSLVMDCTMVLAISDGKLVEFDEPEKLMETEGSLFGQLVEEYWSHLHSAESH
ncbi:ABC TRANSPORTER C FAMILY PROTEIN [Salix purpurea]|uniref:ABC-type xenobiotic transporter n=1 Tax=Salix purpurea TaxID=77065 RepID=A0A9Q1A6Y4_SALPP|nr:ABC TRANSPORTER C FAMILY PROTEIN [Salix purpurea]